MKITTHVDINKSINMFIEKVNSVFEIYAYENGINGFHRLIGTGNVIDLICHKLLMY